MIKKYFYFTFSFFIILLIKKLILNLTFKHPTHFVFILIILYFFLNYANQIIKKINQINFTLFNIFETGERKIKIISRSRAKKRPN